MRFTLSTFAAVALVSLSVAAQERARTTMPVLIKEVRPEYPAAAKERKIQGFVELAVVVQADGTVGDEVRVTKSLDPDLDQAAIKAAKQWRFRPGTKDGQAVPVEVDLEMTFSLRDRPAAAQSRVYKIGEEGVKSPVLVKEVRPKYTDNAKARGVHGTVELLAIVKADGSVDDDVRITRSLDPDLDEQAIIATRQWKFRPGTKNEKPVDVEVNIELTFTLK